MAKLYGAALAAYNKKRGIGSSGSRKGSKSIARRGSTTVVTVKAPTPAKPKKKRGGRRRSSGSSAGFRTLKAQVRDLLGAAGYGFLTGDHGKAPSITAMVNKVPVVSAIGAPASHGLLLHFIASKTSGSVRMAAAHLSHAALMQAAHNIGVTGGDFATAVTMAGGDDEISGEIDDYDTGDDDDIAGDDDEPIELE